MSRRQPFLNIRTEGALLPTDLLARLLEGANLQGLKPEDYHLGAGEKLNEAISRSWSRLQSLWMGFRKSMAALPPTDLGTTLTREKWLLQLFQELGYGRLIGASTFEIDGKSYPISHLWHGQHYQVPIHLVSFRAELDKRSEQRIQGASKASPHGLVQEFLNRSEPHLWAFVSNGLKLRILRDNASLTRQAHVEFDLEGIFEGEAYADFRLLWMVCHQSRLEGTAQNRPETCWLEAWSKQAQTDGRRALDHLRDGVQKALETLGTGFIAHKGNQVLRDRLQTGELRKEDFYRQLLRLAYRLIFLFVADDRDLLHIPCATEEARSRYARFYSGQRLRRMAERTRGGRHSDLWVGLRLVFTKLGDDKGCPELGLPALGGFLFNHESLQDLETVHLGNEYLLLAIRNLGLVRDQSGWRLVDYRNLGSEELGSIYESLLELSPVMEIESGIFKLGMAAGNDRKTTGSYYTPDSLVQCLLDSTLDEVVKNTLHGKSGIAAEKAILALKICDPAVGSGHFLVGAAHRLAGHLVQARAQTAGDSEYSPVLYQHALRNVISHCLYGVDINPMAAELCRVSLWLESLEPGKSLSFLDHHIRVGNSLLGTRPELISRGLPDETFIPVEGDDKKACGILKKRNKAERHGFGPLFAQEDAEIQAKLQGMAAVLEDLPDDDPDELHAKELAFHYRESTEIFKKKRQLADSWCAAFLINKHFRKAGVESSVTGITQGNLNELSAGQTLPSEIMEEVETISHQFKFFHWHLAFPEVFAKGGFDCVLGNPPWERVNLKEEEWFAERRPSITAALNASVRKRMIISLRDDEPILFHQFQKAFRHSEGEGHLLRNSGLYPLCGRGDINRYAVFAELMRSLLCGSGIAGCVLPTGIATDDTTKNFFWDVIKTKSLVSLFSFENEDFIFPQVHHSTRFCLFTVGSGSIPLAENVKFIFFARQVEHLYDQARTFTLSSDDISRINPNTRTCPIFRSSDDAELTKAIASHVQPFVRENDPDGDPWNVRFTRMFHMADDASLFRTCEQLETEGSVRNQNHYHSKDEHYLPLYEAKMIHHFDHRWGTYAGQTPEQANQGKLPELDSALHDDPYFLVTPRYWLPQSDLDAKIKSSWSSPWFLGFRDITGATVMRTVIATVLPRVPVGHTVPIIYPGNQFVGLTGLLQANLSAFCLDYCARQKVGGIHLTYGYLSQLPVIPPNSYSGICPWSKDVTLRDWILPRAMELIYTSWDLEPFANECGFHVPPFRWDEERRFILRSELDAAYFHLYLPTNRNGDWMSPDDSDSRDTERLVARFPKPSTAVDFIMDTFHIIKRRDEEIYNGDYRSKRVILEIYESIQGAIRSGQSYQTSLDPPPADLRCCHPPRDC